MRELLAGVYRDGGAFVNDDAESVGSLRARISGRLDRSSLYLVAADGAGVVGWLELHRSGAHRLRHVAVLTIAVAKAVRRRGVATALLHDAYAWCDSVGVLKVSLNVRASNVAAVRLYEAEGFVLEGRERNQIRLAPGERSAPRRRPTDRAWADDDAGRETVKGEFEDNLIMGLWLDGRLGR